MATPLAERTTMVYKGTTVAAGTARQISVISRARWLQKVYSFGGDAP